MRMGLVEKLVRVFEEYTVYRYPSSLRSSRFLIGRSVSKQKFVKCYTHIEIPGEWRYIKQKCALWVKRGRHVVVKWKVIILWCRWYVVANTFYRALSVYNIHWLLSQVIYDDTSRLVLVLLWTELGTSYYLNQYYDSFYCGDVCLCVCVCDWVVNH